MTLLAETWRRIPLKVSLAIILTCLLIGEQFPFSDFPMFGSFVGKTYYLYLADQDGKPVAAKRFGVPTNGIKKFYDGRLRQVKKTQKGARIESLPDAAVAEETLRYLIARSRKTNRDLTALQLVRVDVAVQKNQVVKTSRVAAEVTLP